MAKKTSYRLLSIDLDGTLLSPFFRIASKADCLALQEFMSAGGMPFINTGRAPGAMVTTIDRINKFGPNKIKFISCLNGAYVKDFTDGKVFEHKISHEYCKQCLDIIKNQKAKDIFLWFHLPRSVKKYQIESHPYPWWASVYPFGEVIPISDEKDLAAYKMDIICARVKPLNKFMQELKEHNLDKVMTINRSSRHLIEITPKDVDKGKSIDYFAKKYGVSQNCTCSFGDTFNDLAAFEHSGLAVAIKPKNPDLAAKVHYVIPTKRNGVCQAIYKYLLKDDVDTQDYKLVFSDLDGTLLDGKTKLFSIDTKVALQQCTNHLIPIAIASGRSIYDGLKLVKMMELNPKTNIYIIGNNGATIYDIYTKKYISQTPIDKSTAQKLFDDLTKYVNKYKNDAGFLIHQHSTEILFYNQEFWEKVNLKKTGNKNCYDPWADAMPKYITKYPDDIICYKVLVKFPNNKEALKGNEELKKKYPNLEICLSSDVNVEINVKGVNKGYAAKQLSKLTNIPLNKFLVMGDGQNDIPALKLCKNSYTPSYAPNFVKKEAAHVIKDTDMTKFAATVIYQTVLKKAQQPKIIKKENENE